MNPIPEPVVSLIATLNKLPKIGPRSAERLALHIVQADAATVTQLADVIVHTRKHIQFYTPCGALTENSPCPICGDPRRNDSLICVVEQTMDILSIEKS